MKYENIIPNLEKKYSQYSSFKIAGRKLFKRHCGMRMWKVKTYSKYSECPIHTFETRGYDILVCACPECNYITPDISMSGE